MTTPRALAYRLYERRLRRGLEPGSMPAHVAVVLDGNRRYARAHGLAQVSEGHRRGANKIDEFLGWCGELGLPYVTLWLLSPANLSRDDAEVGELTRIIGETVSRLAAGSDPSTADIRLSPVGALDLVPDDLRRRLKEAEAATAGNAGPHVQVAVGYGGREEISDALRRMLSDAHAEGRGLESVADEVTPERIADYLYTRGTPDPDLIIRTSGELRLSGFLLWQSVSSEFYFCEALWPEFRRVDFLRALRSYQSRQRRYGR